MSRAQSGTPEYRPSAIVSAGRLYHKLMHVTGFAYNLLFCSFFYWFEIWMKKTGIQVYVTHGCSRVYIMFVSFAGGLLEVKKSMNSFQTCLSHRLLSLTDCLNLLVFLAPCSHYRKPEWFMSALLSSSGFLHFVLSGNYFLKCSQTLQSNQNKRESSKLCAAKQSLIFNHG